MRNIKNGCLLGYNEHFESNNRMNKHSMKSYLGLIFHNQFDYQIGLSYATSFISDKVLKETFAPLFN